MLVAPPHVVPVPTPVAPVGPVKSAEWYVGAAPVGDGCAAAISDQAAAVGQTAITAITAIAAQRAARTRERHRPMPPDTSLPDSPLSC